MTSLISKQQKQQLAFQQKQVTRKTFLTLLHCRMLHRRTITITLFIIAIQIVCFQSIIISQEKLERKVNIQQQRQILSSNESSSVKFYEFVESSDKVQLHRMKSIRRFCKSSKIREKTKYNDEITLVTDSEKRLGYCHVPKVASSAWYEIYKWIV